MRAARRPKEAWEAVILDRALETFGREGFGVPMSQLIEESGAPTGTYYRLFPDKGAVFARLLDDLHPRFLEQVTASVDPSAPAALRLGATVTAMVEVALRDYREVARLYLRDVRGARSALAAARAADARERAVLTTLIEEGIESGELDCVDPSLVATAISGMVRKVVEGYVAGDRRSPGAAVAAAIVGDAAIGAAGGTTPPRTADRAFGRTSRRGSGTRAS